jgi:hypothetical protein
VLHFVGFWPECGGAAFRSDQVIGVITVPLSLRLCRSE